MTVPVFLEVILNPDLLPVEKPFVLAHEWAHLAGYADESEANFVAWLACCRATTAGAIQRVARRLWPRRQRAAAGRRAALPPLARGAPAGPPRDRGPLRAVVTRVRTAARAASTTRI